MKQNLQKKSHLGFFYILNFFYIIKSASKPYWSETQITPEPLKSFTGCFIQVSLFFGCHIIQTIDNWFKIQGHLPSCGINVTYEYNFMKE